MKTLSGLISMLGFIVLAGAVGNDDFGTQFPSEATASFGQNYGLALVGLIILAIGVYLLNRFAKRSGSRYY